MAQLDRRGHRHFRTLFIDLFDIWNRRLIRPERPSQTGGRRFSDRKRRLPASLAALLLGGILACGGGGTAADKGGPPLAAPLITSQPSSQTVTAGASASFTVAASGNPAPTFTWERSNDSGGTWAAISGANAPTHTFAAAKADHQARFRARATNTVNTAISDAATLNVQWLDITTQPAGQAVTAPAAATFAITVDANPVAIFQWQASADGTRWSDLSGATGISYTTGATTLSDSGKQFRCVATNAARELASDPATLTVNAPLAAPAFTLQPASQTVTAGSDATFTVAASGNPSPTFAWERSNDGGGTWAVISGATSATYAFTAQLADHSAQFRAKATNSVDTAVSEAATLSVNKIGHSAWATVAAGGVHSVGIKEDGTLWAWGSNLYGQLGNGNNEDQHVPVQIGVDRWSFVAAGYVHTVAIKTDGTLWSWGNGGDGQLGNDSFGDWNAPVQIGTAHWSLVAAGRSHTVAIRSDGTLWAWGSNSYGLLGGGTSLPKSPVPVQIGKDQWQLVATGSAHTMAIKTDGTLWAWGNNYHGQLGTGNNTTWEAPVQIGTDHWSFVSAGEIHSLAIKTDGTLWAWGWNSQGQLGNGNNHDQNAPVPVGTARWSRAAAGWGHTVAIQADGSLWAWGNDAYGQLGDGVWFNDQNLPVKIGTDRWSLAAAGFAHTLSIKADGTLWAWGYNFEGEIGDGTWGRDTHKNAPVPVP